jgi:hypothetical protein
MVVVKHPMNAEASSFLCNPCHFSNTLDVKLPAALMRRRDKQFNSDIRPDWWGLGTEDQSTIQSDVVREASLCVLHPIIPVENDGESELVSSSASALQAGLTNWEEIHT